ncbi:Late embryogenesis abundant protein [Sesbania bispinosa]|nr:Late embryogenesis abundant protein [Sesbania bispinosa]
MLANPPLPLPSEEQTNPPSLEQIGISKQLRNQHSLTNKSSKLPPTLGQPRLQKTKPIVWCAAVLCFIFSLLLIFFGIATLIFYFAIKPKNPIFDIPNASLNVVHFDSTEYLNGEFTLLANFSNPNRRIDVRFESLDIELFFSDRLISSQSIKPFTQRPGETRLQTVNFISSLVFLPQDVGVKLQRQVQSNRVNYNARGTFKVRANMGLIHLSYWLHSRCQIEMTGPPTGVLVARQCITRR